MRFRAFLFLIVAAGLLGFSAYVASVELKPYLQGNIASFQPEEGLAKGLPDVGLSLQSQQLALMRCAEAARSVTERLQPSKLRQPAMRNCQLLADRITSASPTNSFAWLVGAMAAAELVDPIGMRDRLRRSQETGPTEQWIAQGRVELAENARRRFGPDGLDFEAGDLKLLVLSQSGIGAIASRYLGQPDFRDRITTIVETLPERDQERFVNWVAGAARELLK
ncbi:MAG TPA: hypothetical protein VIL84_00310 [Devosiaceae bacterium]